MKKWIAMLLLLALMAGMFGCAAQPAATEPSTTAPTQITQPPTDAPTEPPTEPPTVPPTEPPTEPPTVPPTKPPTQPPTEPTEAPATVPTQSNDEVTVVAGGDWDHGPVTWEITSDGTLTIGGGRYIQEGDYIWRDYSNIVTKIVVEDGIEIIPKNAFAAMANVTGVYLSKDLTEIGPNAFRQCTALESITIPAGVTTISSWAFRDCPKLANVDFADDSKLKTIGEKAFSGSGITRFVAPDGLRTIEVNAFLDCPTLETVHLKGNELTVRASAFKNCTGLKELVVDKTTYDLHSGVFDGCYAIETLKIYSTNMSYWFEDRTMLKTLVIEGKLTRLYGFEGCTSLASVTLNAPITRVGNSVFSNCSSLTELTLPDTVTSIENYAFRYSGIKKIVIPASVTEMGWSVFSFAATEEIVFRGDCFLTPYDNVFSDLTATVYYPADNETWTEDVLIDYGGHITWVPYTGSDWKDEPPATEPPTEPDIEEAVPENLYEMMLKYHRIDYALKQCKAEGPMDVRVSLDSQNGKLNGNEALKYCYEQLIELEALDPWLNRASWEKYAPDLTMPKFDRKAYLEQFTIVEDVLLRMEKGEYGSIHREEDFVRYFYNHDGTVNHIYGWAEKVAWLKYLGKRIGSNYYYGYDENGRVNLFWYGDHYKALGSMVPSYDEQGRLTGLHSKERYYNCFYNEDGRLSKVEYGDAFLWDGDEVTYYSVQSWELTYTCDENGRVTRLVEREDNGEGNGYFVEISDYTYNEAGQAIAADWVVQWWDDNKDGDVLDSVSRRQRVFTYDDKGRLLSETVYSGENVTEDGKPVIPADATTYTYVYGDQYVFGEYKIAKPDKLP